MGIRFIIWKNSITIQGKVVRKETHIAVLAKGVILYFYIR
jgi:hypothetical protein